MEGEEARRGHICDLCGYQYPNAIPSAKLRRSHLKNCRKMPAAEGEDHGVVADQRYGVYGYLMLRASSGWLASSWFACFGFWDFHGCVVHSCLRIARAARCEGGEPEGNVSASSSEANGGSASSGSTKGHVDFMANNESAG
ncbi:hypothetical protein GUJ93_ZPchr0013g38025 [Zizania palustris]|uniref:Uncharacterized protein n=1 Tax=Zizania palustris TaxID=103762 RepID=A0A8J6BXC5_ZIZPA|nr:hypothetical protein GUJ93_ZPchr0013g38025 [Zizania palustris]